ncbi:type II secretion system protein GspG [bacterium]|nr:type II secretion system protein GspG [bacterium]
MKRIFRRKHKRGMGFTLIELLIVVAIIAILAAIAVPNFLEAQTRSKISRIKADARTIATAVESYHVDNNHYPLSQELPAQFPGSPFNDIGGGYFAYTARLTTPISYLTSCPRDPYNMRNPLGYGWDYFEFWSEPSVGFDLVDVTSGSGAAVQYVIWSWGPDLDSDNFFLGISTIYDATNGTVSDGNIYRFGP